MFLALMNCVLMTICIISSMYISIKVLKGPLKKKVPIILSHTLTFLHNLWNIKAIGSTTNRPMIQSVSFYPKEIIKYGDISLS